jgi:thiamine-phosphate pyrophosphorylase
MRGLYAIVDLDTLGVRGTDPIAFAQSLLTVRPAALQLRAKAESPREVLRLLRELGPLCRHAGVPLVANDRPDLAVLAGCAMVHVGQSDMPLDQVRRLAPDLGVGVSTHTLAQLDEALARRPTYVAFGPVFKTASKENPDPVVGLPGLREAYARSRAAGVPLVAIGGITRESAASLRGLADAVAVIGALVPPSEARVASQSGEWLDEVALCADDLATRFGTAPHAGAA